MTKLLSINSKISKAAVKTADFAILPVKTCPFAGECRKYCYAQKGFYKLNPAVWSALRYRYTMTKSKAFVDRMCTEISRAKVKAIRIHSAGDFYSAEYLGKWIAIAERFPDIKFYAYTKSVRMVKSVKLPSNMIIIYSLGGLQDADIDTSRDRHARIFSDIRSLRLSGYVDCSKDDTRAWRSKSGKIGLVAH